LNHEKIRLLLCIFGFWLFSFSTCVRAADGGALDLYFENARVNPEIKAIVDHGVKYVNLPFLINYLHLGTAWDHETGSLSLKFGRLAIQMHENQPDYQIDDHIDRLRDAPFERDGQLWIPVEFLLQLGLVISKEDSNRLYLQWAENYLLAVENIKYEGRTAFLLVGAKKPVLKSFFLTQPDRVVLDFAGALAHPALDTENLQNDLVNKVRFDQFQPDKLRLVFDLKRLAGYNLIPVPENDNQIMLVFNYFVENISFIQNEAERKIYIKSSAPPRYKVKTMLEPRRLVIDFEGATLAGNADSIVGDLKWIKTIRMSQYNSHTVRIVLDILDEIPCFITPSRTDPNRLEIRTVQKITKVDWTESAKGGSLVIESDGELVETVQRLREPHKLLIDLRYSVLLPDLKVPSLSSDQITGLRLAESGAFVTRVEVDLKYYMEYTAKFSEDRRRLTINLRKSPVIEKTIVLDPGHGGVDMGATGRQGTREKNVNYEVIIRLKKLLEEAGANIILTRNDDSFISLYERSLMANYYFADIFVSIHTNFHPNGNVRGIEVYHYQGRDDGNLLAKSIEMELANYTRLSSLGVKTNDFVVIRETQMPSVLVELGYLSNLEEENIIKTDEFREEAANGIFQGILEYYYSLEAIRGNN